MDLKVSEIKVYSEINEKALAAKKDLSLACWYELRAFDRGGKGQGVGWVYLDEAIAHFAPYCSERSLQRHLDQGKGLFFLINEKTDPQGRTRKVIRISGLQLVAQRFDIHRLSPRPQIIPAKAFVGLQQRRAFLFATTFPPVRKDKKAKPVSRANLEERIGVAKRTQLRYEKLVKAMIFKRKNFARARNSKGELKPLPWRRDEGGRFVEFAGRLPNSYRSRAATSQKGMIAGINKALRNPLVNSARGLHSKLYFLSARELGRMALVNRRQPTNYLWLDPYQRCKRSCREWEVLRWGPTSYVEC